MAAMHAHHRPHPLNDHIHCFCLPGPPTPQDAPCLLACVLVPAHGMARINLPPLTRGLLAGLVLFTLLNFALRPHSNWVDKVEQPLLGVGNGVPFLAIVPRKSVVYPWVFALATVVEQNVLGLVATGLTVFYGGRYLERAWGSREFPKFILFVAVIPNVLSFLLYAAGYLLTGKSFMLYAPSASRLRRLR